MNLVRVGSLGKNDHFIIPEQESVCWQIEDSGEEILIRVVALKNGDDFVPKASTTLRPIPGDLLVYHVKRSLVLTSSHTPSTPLLEDALQREAAELCSELDISQTDETGLIILAAMRRAARITRRYISQLIVADLN